MNLSCDVSGVNLGGFEIEVRGLVGWSNCPTYVCLGYSSWIDRLMSKDQSIGSSNLVKGIKVVQLTEVCLKKKE